MNCFKIKCVSLLPHQLIFGVFICILSIGCQKKEGTYKLTTEGSTDKVEQITFPHADGLNIYSLPIAGEFVLPQNTVSFALIAFDNKQGGINIKIKDPSQRNIFENLIHNQFITNSNGAIVLLNPLVPSMPMQAGVWKYHLQNVKNVKIAIRTGAIRSILPIRPVLTGTAFDTTHIQSVIIELQKLFQNHGLIVKSESILHLKDSKFSALKPDFKSPLLAELASHGESKRINIFFVEEILQHGNLGIAAKTPGTLGVEPLNMVLINLFGHGKQGGLDYQKLATTTAHEIGHLLGLFHTTEKHGSLFDPLSDTPECRTSQGLIASFNHCQKQDAKNIMFWQADSLQKELSPSQVYILKHSPLAK